MLIPKQNSENGIFVKTTKKNLPVGLRTWDIYCFYSFVVWQAASVSSKSHHDDGGGGAEEAQAQGMFDWDAGYGQAYTQEQVDGKNIT